MLCFHPALQGYNFFLKIVFYYINNILKLYFWGILCDSRDDGFLYKLIEKPDSMKNCIFFWITFMGIILPLNAQEISDERNYTDSGGLKQGFWEVKYPNGNLRYQGSFRNDRPVGEFIRYFPSGSRMAVMNFCESGIMAETILFYQDGSLAAKGIYLDEKKDSVWNYYSYYDDRPVSFETYNNGVKEGASGVYYPGGQLSETFWYENDVRNGPWRQYYENGRKRTEAMFENDQRHGEFRFYSPSGRLEIKGNYYRNQMHGEWTWYDEAGREESSITYIEGRPGNEDELIEKEQEMFRVIEEMRGRIPEPDESELFSPRR